MRFAQGGVVSVSVYDGEFWGGGYGEEGKQSWEKR